MAFFNLFSFSKIVPFDEATEKAKGKGFNYNGQEYIHHSSLRFSQSAFYRFSVAQKIILFILSVVLIIFLINNWHATFTVLIGAITFFYFLDLLFNLYLISQSSLKKISLNIPQNEIEKLDKSTLPIYTVLCPLYKEWTVIPQFIKAMSNLDYPKDKLQIMLLLEEDDKETLQNIDRSALPAYFEIVIVPKSKPRTKPKALNYALQFAKGKYVVIYDAEDIPEPLQLKKAILGFEKADPKTICIQAKLNFYNPHQNILTRAFTAEYALWFDLVLTGLQYINAPIPLGGTSNHFKVSDILYLKGWDAFNVTEDADLGMRLTKKGFKTAIIDSTTLEEANSELSNWFNQRRRWVKGYIQTYFVHMRDLKKFNASGNKMNVILFQIIIGGKISSMLINLVMWTITIVYILGRLQLRGTIDAFFPTPILYMGILCLVVGNFLYMYYYMIAAINRGYDSLVKYLLLIPFYWLGISIAAWAAVFELLYKPHYWSKTKHGLHIIKNLTPLSRRVTYS